jgi:type IV pilus assembly protein PilM
MALPFLSRQKKKRDQIVAIDLGGRTTKAVQLQRRGEKLSLQSYAMLETPISGKPLSASALAEHFKNVHGALGGGRARQVTLALSVVDTFFRQIEVPLMPVADLRLMLKYNAKTYLQQDLPDHVFDCCYILSKHLKPAEGVNRVSGQKHRVLVSGAKRQLIEDVQTAIREAGLVPEEVMPGVLGPTNAFELAESEIFAKEIVALVDIGFKNSTITILDCGEFMLHRVVGLGGDGLTTGLVEALGVGYAEAEQIKIGMPTEVQQNLDPLIQPLARELRASIDFFETQHDKSIGQVYVSGGSAQSEYLLQSLQAELMVQCKSWSATRSLQMALDPQKMGEVEQVGPQLTVAIGAAAAAF